MKTPDQDDEDQPISLSEAYSTVEPAPLPAIGSDGGFVPQIIGVPPPIPDATPANWICLRGPCKHYLHLIGHFDAANPAETMEGRSGFRKHYHYCRAIPGTYIEIEDDIVYECNRWDPDDSDDPEIVAREHRRRKFLEKHPEFRVIEEPDEHAEILAAAERELNEREEGGHDGNADGEERDRGHEDGPVAGSEGQVPRVQERSS